MKRLLMLSGAVALSLTLTGAGAAELPMISHSPITCVPEDSQHAKVVARIDGASSARVYFRASQETEEYFVEMLRDPNGYYWAALPFPEEATDTAIYRVVAKGPTGATASTMNFSVPVRGECAPFKFRDEEVPVSENLVVGWMTDDNELKGWRCQHVSNRITPRGEMKRWERCLPAGWLPRDKALIAGAIGVGVIGVIDVVKDDDGSDTKPISLARP